MDPGHCKGEREEQGGYAAPFNRRHVNKIDNIIDNIDIDNRQKVANTVNNNTNILCSKLPVCETPLLSSAG
jgi:hypothetical protein